MLQVFGDGEGREDAGVLIGGQVGEQAVGHR